MAIELRDALRRRLEAMHVQIGVPDPDTVVLQNVPANPRYFNKGSTNVLVKRPARGMPYLVCVDEDLEYTGPNPGMVRALASGIKRNGWRTLALAGTPRKELQAALEDALAALGSDGQEPRLVGMSTQDPAEDGDLLTAVGVNLSRMARDGKVQPTVGREEEVEQVAACLLRWGQARMALVVGAPGVGKTNLVHAVACRLLESRPELELLAVDLGSLLAGTLFDGERESILARVLEQAAPRPETILVLEHAELGVRVPSGHLLLCRYLDRGRSILGTALPTSLSPFGKDPLGRRLHLALLEEPSPGHAVEILSALRERVARHHHVEIEPSCIPACVKAAGELPGQLPAKAIDLLDSAAARASLNGGRLIGLDDIYFAARVEAGTRIGEIISEDEA